MPHAIPYDPNKFIGRKEAIDQITNRIAEIAGQKRVDRRAIHVLGERGTGKTWLLQHLHRSRLPEMWNKEATAVQSVYIDFESRLDGENGENDEYSVLSAGEQNQELFESILVALMYWLAEQFDIKAYDDGDIPDLSSRLQRGISRWADDKGAKVIVFFLDGIYSRPKDFLKLLEEHLLRPLMGADSRILMVMSGRGEAHRWIAADLGSFSDEVRIPHFERDELAEMLKKHGFSVEALDMDYIYRISGGYPLTAYRLATGISEGEEQSVILTEIIQMLFDFVSIQGKDLTIIINYMRALCILNPWDALNRPEKIWVFRKSAIVKHIDAYTRCLDPEADIITNVRNTTREIFDTLRDLQIIHWNNEANGYLLDEALRVPVAMQIKYDENDLWRCLHRHAYERYLPYQKRESYKPILAAHKKEMDGAREATEME